MDFRKRNIFLVLISLLAGVAIFIWFGKVIGWEKIGEAFEVFKGWQGIVIVALSFLVAIAGNWRWYEILKDKEIHIPFWQLFRTYLGGYSMMFLFPIIFLSGEIFRVFAIAKENRVPTPMAASSVIIERILEWTVNILIIFFALFFFAFKLSILPVQILCVFGVALAFFVSIIGLFYFKALRQKSIVKGIIKRFTHKEIIGDNSIVETEEEVYKFFQPGASLQKGLSLSLLRAGLMLLRVWLLIIFLTNLNVGFVAALAVLGFSYISALIPIPTSLGSHEVIQAAAFSSFGLEAYTATAFAMIIRAGDIIVSLFGLAFLLKKGFNVMEKKFNITTNNINN